MGDLAKIFKILGLTIIIYYTDPSLFYNKIKFYLFDDLNIAKIIINLKHFNLLLKFSKLVG